MRIMVLALMISWSFSSLANPPLIWCDKGGLLQTFSRVQLEKLGPTNYSMTFLKEKKCGIHCLYMDPIFQKNIVLVDTPSAEIRLVTPNSDKSGDKILFDITNDKCSLKLADGFTFKGTISLVEDTLYLD